MDDSGTYKIRPAGRHLRTIGSELIQDQYAALIELIKNAYDADSPEVLIAFKGVMDGDKKGFKIIVSDSGHGMDRDTIINKWLVPSTSDKLKRKTSPNGRVMQGRKGIGRYAASVLGRDLLLESITKKGEMTAVYIEWARFDDAAYLDDVEVLVETCQADSKAGTILTINGDDNYQNWLGENGQLSKLKHELKKIVSPVQSDGLNETDSFVIKLEFNDFLPDQEKTIIEQIEPYPIFQLYDYRISGSYRADGQLDLTYETQKIKGFPAETISINYGVPTGCGSLLFDIRVYDREKEAIESLIKRGLFDDHGDYLDNLQARQLLNDYNGIGVYRNGFRIRPLGDPDFDWLKLNEQRVQKPSMRIGSNQVIGFVQIQPEEESHLEEKSARDGLKENDAYARLKLLTKEVIGKLEERRFIFRKKAGLSRPTLKIERELERLFSFEELKDDIRKKLTRKGVAVAATDEIIGLISKEEEAKNRIVEDIRQAVAIYQGQATLGKIINVVLHEGRRPLSYFKNQVPNLMYWVADFEKKQKLKDIETVSAIAEGIVKNSEVLVSLFGRLDPLASGKRGARKDVNLKNMVADVSHVFSAELKKHKINFAVDGPIDFKLKVWPQDIYAIFTNLIDNSIYWIVERKIEKRDIKITFAVNDGKLAFIDYRDTGPGIDPKLIESEVVFEPNFSTKPGGTGLGLPIAGEAATRCNWELRAFASETGAYFRLLPVERGEHDEN